MVTGKVNLILLLFILNPARTSRNQKDFF